MISRALSSVDSVIVVSAWLVDFGVLSPAVQRRRAYRAVDSIDWLNAQPIPNRLGSHSVLDSA